MDQRTFAEAEYDHRKRKTHTQRFLERMDGLIPWKRLEKKIAPHYPKPGNGRRPYPLSVMLRVHCLQLFYNVSDPKMEDALYDIEPMRRFAGRRIGDPLPDESTILQFRHLLERHRLGEVIFEEINRHLKRQGLSLCQRTIVDATIISAPTSTKNRSGGRDPEMSQTQKGNQWYFGMKMHIGVDEVSGVIHSMETTPANVHDITQTEHLLQGDDVRCSGDAGYQGVEKREEFADRELEWRIAVRPGKRRQLTGRAWKAERRKASTRAKVEHPFRRIKLQFGYSKVRYRGLAKNENRLWVLAAFSNLLTCRSMLTA